MSRKKWGLVGLGFALTLGACGSSGHKAAPPPPPSTSTSVSSSPTSPSSTSGSSSSTAAPATSSTTASGPGRCVTSALSGSLTGENGTAGSVYYTLVLTNHGSTACILQGWPGVSFVTSESGSQVGAAATRLPGSAPSITLAAGASAGAALQVSEAGNYGSGCQITPVSGLKVYPPNQTASLYVAHTDRACANTNDVTLHVGAFQPSS